MLAIINNLKQKAKSKNLWNFWLTDSKDGHGLTTVEYAYLAEEMGKCRLGAEIFNCSAPDTGNMEVLKRYGSQRHKELWLKPLLNGELNKARMLCPPADSPKTVTFDGSPPKKLIFDLTHSRDFIMSNCPKFDDWSSPSAVSLRCLEVNQPNIPNL